MMKKAFRIGDVFDMKRGKEAAPNQVPDGIYNMVNETSSNNGVTKKASSEHIFNGNSITISVNYATTVFYQPEPYCASVNILILENENLNAERALYIIAMLRKNNAQYNYTHKISKNRLAETILEYPVIESSDPNHVYTVDDIDWQYMQDRIAELEQDRIAGLEQDRIAELEAYLAATGLDDYELTDEDKAVLCDEKKMRTYRLGEIFSVESVNKLSIKGKNYVMDKDIVSEDGTVPYIAAISTNNGITGYSNHAANNAGNCITLSTTADSSNTVFYQEQPFIGRQQIAGIRRADGEIMERYVGLYLTAAIRKITRQFNYANKLTKEYLKNCDILLPVIASPDPNHTYTIDDIDFNYTERYIRAMEKLAIVDVVKYTDKVIATTKEIVAEQ